MKIVVQSLPQAEIESEKRSDCVGDIHATMLVEAMQAEGVPAHYTPTFDDAEAYLRAHWQPGDLVITLGCGDIYKASKMMVEKDQ